MRNLSSAGRPANVRQTSADVRLTSAGRPPDVRRTSADEQNLTRLSFFKRKKTFLQKRHPSIRKENVFSIWWLSCPSDSRQLAFYFCTFVISDGRPADVRQTSEEWSEKKWNFFDKVLQNFSKQPFFDTRPILGPFNIKDFEYVGPTSASGIFRALGAIFYLWL